MRSRTITLGLRDSNSYFDIKKDFGFGDFSPIYSLSCSLGSFFQCGMTIVASTLVWTLHCREMTSPRTVIFASSPWASTNLELPPSAFAQSSLVQGPDDSRSPHH